MKNVVPENRIHAVVFKRGVRRVLKEVVFDGVVIV
jgi:hypothetical protein